MDLLAGKCDFPLEESQITDHKYRIDFRVASNQDQDDPDFEVQTNGTNSPVFSRTGNIYSELSNTPPPTSVKDVNQPERKLSTRDSKSLGVHTLLKSKHLSVFGENDKPAEEQSANEVQNSATSSAGNGAQLQDQLSQTIDRDRFARINKIFHRDVNKWENGQYKLKSARRLLYDSVSAPIQKLIPKVDDPFTIYSFLRNSYGDDDNEVQELLSKDAVNARLADHNPLCNNLP